MSSVEYDPQNVVWKGKMYTVNKYASPSNVVKSSYVIEELATGLRLSQFTKLGLAVATAKGLDEGMGYAGWTPSFIARAA